ncbi:MAG: hypothetical protein EPO42_04975 [Gallionellaceae bacterium]|nr:MAG: hypothetical protein EPO42_04975 [Gallionellaceae bacterium]
MGNVLREARKYDAAEAELLAGLNAIRLMGDKYSEATGNLYLARLEESRGDNAKAKQWYGQAESLFREIGDMTHANQMRSEAAALK